MLPKNALCRLCPSAVTSQLIPISGAFNGKSGARSSQTATDRCALAFCWVGPTRGSATPSPGRTSVHRAVKRFAVAVGHDAKGNLWAPNDALMRLIRDDEQD